MYLFWLTWKNLQIYLALYHNKIWHVIPEDAHHREVKWLITFAWPIFSITICSDLCVFWYCYFNNLHFSLEWLDWKYSACTVLVASLYKLNWSLGIPFFCSPLCFLVVELYPFCHQVGYRMYRKDILHLISHR